MRTILSILLLVNLVQAQSISRLVEQSLKKHPSLQTIKHRLTAMDERILKSQKWQNPDLSFTVNNIQFSDLSNRSLEPMQYEALNVTQKFPWFGKLKARKDVEEARKHLLLNSYDAAKVALALQIKITSYTVKELEARIYILRKYIQLAKQNIKLYTDTIATDSMSHAESITAELSLSKIEVRMERYSALLKAQKEKLAYLVQSKVGKIDDRLYISRLPSLKHYLSKMSNNPTYRMKDSKQKIAAANKALVDLEATPDPYVKMGYFHRNDFEDYASVTVGFAVPIYGTETLNSEIARKERLSARSDLLDYRSLLESEIRSNYARLKEASRIYFIIQEKSLPQLSHMLELSSAAIEKGADLFTYTNILEQKLSLEEESIAVVAEYLRTKAKLKALTGEI
ncbi:TolC family protein [Sulfurovum sp. ST-21]|uniref:TolC family protein n=1 Tax=Sulfurovum indicum TaxID=2779528 RepID=A0A7M1S5R8_9BACT|nr:TolC family protein [Sulfurovum indicum]QOR62767.1 TolC family protein [Sulfurovum indicum]